MHADNGLCAMSPSKVMDLLHRVCRGGQPPAAIAIIEGPERIEAAICLDAMQHWYSDDWFWVDRFIYVHPLHRKSRRVFTLLRFAEWWHQQTGAPVVLTIETQHDVARKAKLYSRFGRLIGGTFVIGKLPVEENQPVVLS